MPKSLLGKYALGLLIIFLLCFVTLITDINDSIPEMMVGFSATITGIATFITGLISLTKYKDRSPAIILTIIFGAIVVLATVGAIVNEVVDYISGSASPSLRTLVWVDKEGDEEPLEAPPNSYGMVNISPDGKRIALEVGSYPREDIYIWDIERKAPTKLAIDETREKQPVWTPDSKRIIYYSNIEDSAGGIYCGAFDGSGKVEKLVSSSGIGSFPWSLSRDGKFLFIMDLVSMTNAEISMLPMEGDQERKILLQHEYSEGQPTISPDGQWMAYCSSEESGDFLSSDVYIRPFPDVEKSKTKVSTGGGISPLWSPDMKELFYLSNDNSVMAVTVKTEPTLSLGTPRILFQGNYYGITESSGTPYDIHPDGNRFLMIKPPQE